MQEVGWKVTQYKVTQQNETLMKRLDELLGIMIDKPFNIVGQNLSNPYIVSYKNNNMVLKSVRSGEHIHSWILIELINGEFRY